MKILYKHVVFALCMTEIKIPKCLRQFIYTYTNQDIVCHKLVKQYFNKKLDDYFHPGIEREFNLFVPYIPESLKDYVMKYYVETGEYTIFIGNCGDGHGSYIVSIHSNYVVNSSDFYKKSNDELIDTVTNNVVNYPKSNFVLRNMCNVIEYLYNHDNRKTSNFSKRYHKVNDIDSVIDLIKILKHKLSLTGSHINLPKLFKSLPYDVMMALHIETKLFV